jgi:DNA mismatch endonuclease (patch repair protein)
MSNRLTKVERRRRMSAIGKTNTRPEIAVRSAIHRIGYRFRLHVKSLPGTPDIVLPRFGIVVFVHGCFWHQHRCSLGRCPKRNRCYWVPKLKLNERRDRKNRALLRELGWRVVEIWECETKSGELADLVRSRLKSATKSQP